MSKERKKEDTYSLFGCIGSGGKMKKKKKTKIDRHFFLFGMGKKINGERRTSLMFPLLFSPQIGEEI